jgi:hypothetical protein
VESVDRADLATVTIIGVGVVDPGRDQAAQFIARLGLGGGSAFHGPSSLADRLES